MKHLLLILLPCTISFCYSANGQTHHKKSPSLIFSIDTTRPKSQLVEFASPYRHFSIIDSNYNEVKFRDSCGVWTIETKIDSAHLFRIMAYGVEMMFRSDSIYGAYHYKQLDKAYKTATKWANFAKWICKDYGINYKDVLAVMKKIGYKSTNLNNPHKSKARL